MSMRGANGAPTEQDLRSALRALERHAPDVDSVLRAIADRGESRRSERRWKRWVAPAAAALAVLAIAASLAVAAQARGHHGAHRKGPVNLPRGGRILLYVPGFGLEWIYRHGRTVPIARGFIGATLAMGGSRLLAWRPTQNPRAKPPCRGCFADVDYYLMSLNGTGRRLVLEAAGTTGKVDVGHFGVALSPDGAKLAYVRVGSSKSSGNNVFSQLWVADLATGKRVDLGPCGGDAAWTGDSTLMTETASQSALQRVDVLTGRRTTVLSVADHRIVRAYERARPGAGPPRTIDPVSWSGGARRPTVAVTLWGGSRLHPANAVAALVGRGAVVGLAPDKYPLVSLTWGSGGRFVLESTLAEGAAPPNLYAGKVGSPALYRLPVHGSAVSFAFSPDRTMIAEGFEDGTVYIVPTPAPLCRGLPGCGERRPSVLRVSGTLYGWAP